MFAEDEDRVPEVLDEAECLALLRTAAIGRVAFTEGALPAIEPVPFRMAGGQVLIPTRRGSRLAAGSPRPGPAHDALSWRRRDDLASLVWLDPDLAILPVLSEWLRAPLDPDRPPGRA